ncbi:MAG TPA: hypothetical protein VIG51_10175 [Candidatus Baltobacteraceae bacterium]|jgi:hypothetical protein
MELNADFSDLLRTFNEAGVRYLIVGGHAVAVHDRPRFTKDLDVWVDPTPENAIRTYGALARFGAPMSEISTRHPEPVEGRVIGQVHRDGSSD